MHITRLLVAALFISVANGASASDVKATIATSESRDASTAYLGTANFVVGRVARDCLTLLGRSESPKAFVSVWQQRNGKYLLAMQTYMGARFQEADAAGGPEMRNAVANALNAAVHSGAEATMKLWFEKPAKHDACQRTVAMIESGAYDISETSPMFAELEALVEWSRR